MTFGRPPRGKFVFQKVNKIRWRPSQTQSGRIAGTHFVTGSWDDEVIQAEVENHFHLGKAIVFYLFLFHELQHELLTSP